MKIALFGGSFDPIHNGHIEPVLEAKEKLGLDRIIYLPTARPPHKPGRQFATSHARWTMVELALLGQAELLVSPLELTPGETAYTIDSVEHYRRLYPEDELVLLIGGDSFADFTSWRRWEEILEAVRLAVLVRPGWKLEELETQAVAPLTELVSAGRVDLVKNKPVGVSSTRLRETFARGERPPAGQVPELVVEYIRKYSLYR